jgi:hypothetical protein
MSLALNPTAALQEVSVRAANQRSRWDGPTIALGAIIFAFALLLLANFVPAISEPDDNGYFAQGSLLFTTGHTSFRPTSDAQYIGMHWLLSPTGEYISRYPPGLAVGIGLVYAVAGFRAAVLVNPALAVGTLVGTFLLARRVGLKNWWAAVPVAVLAANPTLIHHALSGDSHTSVACVLVWGLTLLLKWSQEGRSRDLFFAGLVLGIVPTIRYPDAIVALGIAWFIWSQRKSHLTFWRDAACGFAGVLIPVLPLLIRNQLLLGGFWKTGYALTNEQTGFGFNYFAQHALQYIQQIQSGGLGLFLALGLLGITLMICLRSVRPVGILLASLTVPMLLLYMAYYWAPQNAGATMRFLLPTFPLYVLAGVWAMMQLTDQAPRGAKIAVPAVVGVVQLLWSIPDGIDQLSRMSSSKKPLAMMTDAIERSAKPGDVVVVNGLLAQHLDFVRKWKVADSSLVTGRGGGMGGPMGGPPGGGMGGGAGGGMMGPPNGMAGGMGRGMGGGGGMGGPPGTDGGADAPSPMQAEKRDLQRSLYKGDSTAKQTKFASDLLTWAGDGSIYVVGTEPDVRATFNEIESDIEIVERVKLPSMPMGGPGGGMGGPPGMGGGMGGGQMAPGMNGPPGMGGQGMGGMNGGGMNNRRAAGGRGMRGDDAPVEWVIAKWTPAA